MKNVVFLTGATGLIGGNLALRILRQFKTTGLIVLVRDKSAEEARERFWATVSKIDPDLKREEFDDRVQVVQGDVDAQNLGLPQNDLDVIMNSVTHIIHSAASVKFHLPLEEIRAVNVRGTANVLALANEAYRYGRLRRFAYVSTAYVSGRREGIVMESDLEHTSGFANTYEQSKYETEQMVRTNARRLPTIIFRPSIVVGDSQTGITTAFNVLYVPLRFIIQGLINTLPGSASIPLDVVPVDFVRDAICHIMFEAKGCLGKTFHLTAGSESITTTGEIIGLVGRWFTDATGKEDERDLRFVSPEEFSASARSMRGGRWVMKMLAAYESYLCCHRMFDTTNLRAALKGSGIRAPRFCEYYRAIMHYFVGSLALPELKQAA